MSGLMRRVEGALPEARRRRPRRGDGTAPAMPESPLDPHDSRPHDSTQQAHERFFVNASFSSKDNSIQLAFVFAGL